MQLGLPGDPIPMHTLQRRHPKCYPYGAMVLELLERAGLLPGVPRLVIVDLTYGRGKFWSCLPVRPRLLVGYDIRLLEWTTRPDLFRLAPAWTAVTDYAKGLLPAPDIVAIDPPWQTCHSGNGCRPVGRRNHHFRASRAIGSPETILNAGARLAREAGSLILAHYKTRWIPDGFHPLVR